MSTVQSVERTFRIIECFKGKPDGLTILELTKSLDLHKSTVHRLLQTLSIMGYIKQADDGRYQLTYKMYEIGASIIDQSDIRSVAAPFLKDLRDLVNEVIHLVIPEGNSIVYIDKYESTETIRMHSTIGKRMPMYCTSVGKAILSAYPEEKASEIIENSNLEKITESTITSQKALMEDLKISKSRGFAIDDEENEMGIKCFGAPIYNFQGEPIAAISISTPLIRLNVEKEKHFQENIIETSQKISKAMGYIK